jgi:SAM-dependent methyltransferase
VAGIRRIALFARTYILAATACVYLFTLGVLSARNRGLIAAICRHFGLRSGGPATTIPSVPPSAAAEESLAVEIREPEAGSGNVSLLELLIIARIVRSTGPRAIFEIGTFDGRTTLNLSANAPEGAKVFTLDLSPEAGGRTRLPAAPHDREFLPSRERRLRFRGTGYEDGIVALRGDSADFDFSPYEGRMDLVFVDGSHSYDYVVNDSEKALRLLREGGGVVIWHDYGVWEGATRALNGLHAGRADCAGMRRLEGTSLVVLFRPAGP